MAMGGEGDSRADARRGALDDGGYCILEVAEGGLVGGRRLATIEPEAKNLTQHEPMLGSITYTKESDVLRIRSCLVESGGGGGGNRTDGGIEVPRTSRTTLMGAPRCFQTWSASHFLVVWCEAEA